MYTPDDIQNVTTNGTVQTVSGLEPNCVYTFQVAAVGVSSKIGRFSSIQPALIIMGSTCPSVVDVVLACVAGSHPCQMY